MQYREQNEQQQQGQREQLRRAGVAKTLLQYAYYKPAETVHVRIEKSARWKAWEETGDRYPKEWEDAQPISGGGDGEDPQVTLSVKVMTSYAHSRNAVRRLDIQPI